MIGLLYESGEWSDYKLAAELAEAGAQVRMLDLAHISADQALEVVAECSLIVSRIFASAVFRGNHQAHRTMEQVCAYVEAHDIPMVNEPRAHFFEIDKRRATLELAAASKAGESTISTPTVQACGLPAELLATTLSYPCIVKPNCGGRTTYTAIAHHEQEARSFLEQAPALEFIVEGYIVPEQGFLTRVELIDGECRLMVKRSVVDGGLSAYHLGSTYELYPDCPNHVLQAVTAAGRVLGITFGSFDVIEHGGRAYIIDANSVSNVAPDNTVIFGGFDLMREYARSLVRYA